MIKKNKLLLLIMMIMLPFVASADPVEIDGIYYNLIAKANVAEVTYHPTISKYYSGSIVIPETVNYNNVTYTVTSVGRSAFFGCYSLTSVSIPNSVTSIGSGAFNYCYGLTSITIPNSVTSLGEMAFRSCTGLTSVIIGNSVTSIEDYVFDGCSDLTSVIIGNSVTSIGFQAFNSCSKLSSVSIPNSVTSIGGSAFRKCSTLTSVTIGNSVASIGEMAFRFCSALTSIIIPNSVASIGERAFDSCPNLTSVILGNSLTNIGACAFAGCFALTTVSIPNSVTSIDGGAFSSCTNLTSVTIGNSVRNIGNGAFNGCSALTSVTIGNGIQKIGSSAFQSCPNLADVICYSGSVPQTASDVFKDSYIEYTTLYVPASSIDSYANTEPWNNFYNILDINAPEYSLNYVINGEVYKSYKKKEGAFIIPEPEPTKEGYTFSGWSDIPETMPAHDVTVTGTFSVKKYKLVYKVDGTEYKSYDVEEGESITPEPAPTKEGYTFSGWSDIPETMPANDVTVTGSFSVNKYKLVYKVDDEEYKSYDVEYGAAITPEETPTKEGYTFSGWSDIPETMPANDVTVTGTFSVNKYKLVYKVDGEEYKNYDVEYGAAITPEETPTKEGYTFSGWSDIPETMPAKDVTVTGTFSINKYKLIYKVDGEEYKSYDVEYGATITPEPVPTKEGYTFSGWSEIPETMPANDVTDTGTFSVNKYKLTYTVDGEVYKSYDVEYGATITPEPTPTKEGFTFSGWSDIPETMPAYDVTITGTFTQIDYVVGETTYEIQNDEVSIKDGSNQSGDVEIQTTVVINDQSYTVTSIAENAFKGNSSITSVTIPNSITQIGANAFEGCTGLSEITIGNGVATIGSKAFANIVRTSNARSRATGTGLKVSCYSENVPSTASNAFENTPISNGTLLVDDNSVAVYKNSAPWSGFGNIMGFKEATGIDRILYDENVKTKIFSIDGKALNTPQKGINIINGKKIVIK